MLQHLATAGNAVFKGGTCLAKIHAEFYRLSEDLDFTVSLPTNASRSVRGTHAEPMRQAVLAVPAPFRVVQPMTGHNNSCQYNGSVCYVSLLDGHSEAIHIELSLREPLLLPTIQGIVRTVLLDPISGTPLVASTRISAITRSEAFSEKFRAALSRRKVAIRDFFDLDYAVENLDLQTADPALTQMVRRKLAVSGNDPVDIGPERLRQLRGQVDTRLRPVLRPADFAAFNLDRAFAIATKMASLL